MLILKMLLVAAVGAVAIPPAGLKVSSSAFKANGSIPAKYSCEGEEVSPPLSISNIPAGAKSLAIIVHDPDAPRPGGFTHWVLWNIPATTTDVEENFKGATQGLNGAKQAGYKGMCPPTGAHHYHFMVYALDEMLTLDSTTTDKEALEKAIQGHVLARSRTSSARRASPPPAPARC